MEEEVMGVEANATKERWVNKQGEDTAEKASTVSGEGVSNASSLSTSACRVAEQNFENVINRDQYVIKVSKDQKSYKAVNLDQYLF